MRFRLATLFFGLIAAVPAWAATPITGRISDTAGGLPRARRSFSGTSQPARSARWKPGRTVVSPSRAPDAGTYLLIVTLPGFSEAARTVVVDDSATALDVSVQLEVGVVSTEVSVTANRAERETRGIPLHVEGISRAAVEQANTLSTGDALATVANITPVGNGPFGIRPRLRGLDSTRLLVLFDGERPNTARQATDRTGAETGLISPDAISRVEIVNGAGTLRHAAR